MIVVVLAFLGLFLYYLWGLWLPDGIPQLTVYLVVLAATAVAMLLFASSLLAFVLPRLVGLRGAPGEGRAGKD